MISKTQDVLERLAASLETQTQQRDALEMARAAVTGDGQAFLEFFLFWGESTPLEPASTFDVMSPLFSIPSTLPAQTQSLLRVGDYLALCAVIVRVRFTDRPAAISVRDTLSARADAIYATLGSAFGADVLDMLVRMTGVVVDALSATAANLAPLVKVTTPTNLPSSLIAFDLYGDASRGREIVLRNNAATPLSLSAPFEALAS